MDTNPSGITTAAESSSVAATTVDLNGEAPRPVIFVEPKQVGNKTGKNACKTNYVYVYCSLHSFLETFNGLTRKMGSSLYLIIIFGHVCIICSFN